MGTIRGIKENVQRFNYDQAVHESLEATADRPVIYTQEQLHVGERSDGKKLKPYKSKGYSTLKFAENPSAGFGIPDYHLYGDFYLGIQTKINTKTIDTFGTDSKSPKLETREGGDGNLIYGMNDKNKTKYAIQDVKPVLIAKVKAGIFGG
jgi:hypothetical protein